MKKKTLSQGMNRRDLETIFRGIGGLIEYPRGTGEVRYRHPRLPHVARANARRKDASRELVSYVRDAQRACNDNSAIGESEVA